MLPTAERNILSETVSISTLNSLPFPCRRLQSGTGPITLGTSHKKAKQNDIDLLNQISCAQVDYTSAETGLHRLPVNFNCSASEYNRLLITNGRSKHSDIRTRANPLQVQNVQCLNVPIYLKNQQQRAAAAAKSQRMHLTKSEQLPETSCACCCCEDYCQQCDEEIKLNQRIKGVTEVPLSCASPIKGEASTARKVQTSTVRKRSEVKTSHYTEIRKFQTELKQKRRGKTDWELEERNNSKFKRVRPIIQENLAKHKSIQMQRKKSQSKEKSRIAQARKLIFSFGERVRQYNRNFSDNTFKQEYPWGIDQKKIEEAKQAPAIDYKAYINARPKSSLSKEKKQQQANIKCHPVANISEEQRKLLRLQHFKQAMSQLKHFKQQELQNKRAIKSRLQNLSKQTKEILKQNPKKKFNPKKDFDVSVEKDKNKDEKASPKSARKADPPRKK